MNRRGFLQTMLRAGVAAAALPAATTYARIWTPPRKLFVYRSNILGIYAQLEACNSVALEALPFQDELARWLSVYMATVKSNLVKTNLEIIAPAEYRKHIENWAT